MFDSVKIVSNTGFYYSVHLTFTNVKLAFKEITKYLDFQYKMGSSVIMSTCSCREPVLNSQHRHSSSQSPITAFLGDLIPSSKLCLMQDTNTNSIK